jgi:dTDP-glucose pyrophosphorylase
MNSVQPVRTTPHGLGMQYSVSESIVGNESFVVNAGDAYLNSPGNYHTEQLTDLVMDTEAHAVFPVMYVEDPAWHGVIGFDETESGVYSFRQAVEKLKDLR